MVIACPACHTRYRVDGSIAIAGETSFECSQEGCMHVFVYTPPVLWKGNFSPDVDLLAFDLSAQEEPASQNDTKQRLPDEAEASSPGPAAGFVGQGLEPQTQADQTLGAYLHSMTQQPEAAEAANNADEERGQHLDQDPAGQDPAGQNPADQDPTDQGPEFDSHQSEELPAKTPESEFVPEPFISTFKYGQAEEEKEPRPRFAYHDQYDQYAQEDEQDEIKRQAYGAQETLPLLPVRMIFLLLIGFVLGYAALGYYALSDPQGTKIALRTLPLLGALFVAEPFSERDITLTNLSGSFWLSKDNQRVFAVAATAVNNASFPAWLIQIEGTIYNGIGKKVGQEIVFCGNEANANLLESLTVRDIATLQNLVPPKDFRIPAGQEVRCLLVFTKPPAAVAELEGRVVSAQF